MENKKKKEKKWFKRVIETIDNASMAGTILSRIESTLTEEREIIKLKIIGRIYRQRFREEAYENVTNNKIREHVKREGGRIGWKRRRESKLKPLPRLSAHHSEREQRHYFRYVAIVRGGKFHWWKQFFLHFPPPFQRLSLSLFPEITTVPK